MENEETIVNEKTIPEKIKTFFRYTYGYFIIALISFIYILSGIFLIDKTGKSLMEIITDSSIIFILGVCINSIFGLQGIVNGDRDESVQDVYKKHNEMIDKISPYIEGLDAWCEKENERAIRIVRTRILSKAGLNYSNYFNENGEAKPFIFIEFNEKIPQKNAYNDINDYKFELKRYKIAKKKNKKKNEESYKAYKNAIKVKITELSSKLLTSESGKSSDPNDFGRTKKQFETVTGIKDSISKILVAVILGYYGVTIISEFNLQGLIWTSFQVALLVGLGCLRMMKSTMFVKDEYKYRIKKKTLKMQEFLNYSMKGEKTNVNN